MSDLCMSPHSWIYKQALLWRKNIWPVACAIHTWRLSAKAIAKIKSFPNFPGDKDVSFYIMCRYADDYLTNGTSLVIGFPVRFWLLLLKCVTEFCNHCLVKQSQYAELSNKNAVIWLGNSFKNPHHKPPFANQLRALHITGDSLTLRGTHQRIARLL